MAFPRKLLNDGEEMVLDLRPHWLVLVLPTIALVAAIALSIAVFLFDGDGDGDARRAASLVALLALLVAAAFFVVRLLGWITTSFVLTSDRIITRQGVLSKSGIEIPLERINTVFFNQRLAERIVGAGDLAIESAGERGTQRFENVRKPAIVQREVYVQMEANENRKFDRVGGGGPAGLTAVEQIEKLHDLLTRGAITAAQYDAEKARLLGS